MGRPCRVRARFEHAFRAALNTPWRVGRGAARAMRRAPKAAGMAMAFTCSPRLRRRGFGCLTSQALAAFARFLCQPAICLRFVRAAFAEFAGEAKHWARTGQSWAVPQASKGRNKTQAKTPVRCCRSAPGLCLERSAALGLTKASCPSLRRSLPLRQRLDRRRRLWACALLCVASRRALPKGAPHRGARIMTSCFPSSLGICSTFPISAVSVSTRLRS